MKEIGARAGFSLERKNVNSRELVKPSDLGLIEAVWIHHKELGKPPKSRAQESTKENRIHHKQSTRRTRLKQNQTPREHKEERASFPDQSPYKVSRIHTSNPTPREGREEEQEGRECAREKGAALFWRRERAKGKREGEGVFNPLTLD